MNISNRLHKFTLLSSLYVSQYIPLMFLVQALPVFMRQQGASLESLGLFYLLGLPLLLKVFWSPFIDRYGFTRWGHYRFWIVCFQLLLAGTAMLCAFVDIQTDLTLLFGLLMIMAIFSASQDIATDALAVGLLTLEERGWGNGIQMAGNYCGSILGGGAMLVLLNQLQWTNSLLLLALMVIIALVPILQHREQYFKSGAIHSPWLSVFNFYRRPGIWRWLLILTVYLVGGSMVNGMFRPLLVDAGLTLSEIGWLLGVVGNGAAIVGAVVSGLLTVPWGRKRSLLLFGALQAIAILFYLLPASGRTDWLTLYSVTIFFHLAMGAIFTVSSTVMMDLSQLETAGTDYTAQTSIIYLGSFAAAALSGFIASAIGYQGLFWVSSLIVLFSLILIAKLFQSTQFMSTGNHLNQESYG
ncbi:MAG: MFS transporter [Cyanobacteria bacterium P01_G01_bin.54]